MSNKTFKGFLKLVVALAMTQAPFVPSQAEAAGAVCKPKKTCEDEIKKAQTTDALSGIAAQQGAEGQANQGQALNISGNMNAGAACKAKSVCEEERDKCKPKTGDPCQKQDCEKIVSYIGELGSACIGAKQAAAGGADTQSAAKSGGGGGDMMMGMLMGAALGAGVAMLMNKDKKKDDELQANYDGALQPNGTIDCSKPDAFMYRDCNTFMENRCRTMLDDPSCQQFSARYCGGANAAIVAQPATPPGAALGVDPGMLMGAQGEGVATQYCKGVLAWNYCKTPGREVCPSCLQIQKNQSPACAQNPALCLAQNSLPEIEKAKLTCPTDPAFSDPSFAGGGGAQVPPAVAAGGLPAVVLPQSLGGGNAAAAGSQAATGVSAGVSTGGSGSTGSGNTANSADQANREGYGGADSQAGGVTGSGSGGVATAYGTASAGGRELAQAGGGGFRPASTGGPASDVEGQYGPSLFSTSTQVIRKRCQAGKLNHCPNY